MQVDNGAGSNFWSDGAAPTAGNDYLVASNMILRTLEAFGGNKSRTAATLGISTKTLYTKLQRYGEHPAADRAP